MLEKLALISVSDKTGVVEFARGLHELGYGVISTGGTARHLAEAGVEVMPVEAFTGFPEILGGRVKTLHPAIFGGILARRAETGDMATLARQGIAAIDIVAVNLYLFYRVATNRNASLPDIIENIDIGGVSLLRAAAKNYQDVLVVSSPSQYESVLSALRTGDAGLDFRFRLAVQAFWHTAHYDAVIASYLGTRTPDLATATPPHGFPQELALPLYKVQDLRYGENPHQAASFYRLPFAAPGLADAEKLQGKELSFNNINDADAALACVMEFDQPACVALKHANPCGVAVASDIGTATRLAREADPVSIYGGIVAVNRTFDEAAAAAIRDVFLEVLIAPDYTPEALKLLKRKKDLRVLRLPGLAGIIGNAAGAAPGNAAAAREGGSEAAPGKEVGSYDGSTHAPGLALEVRGVLGGALVQQYDLGSDDPATWRTVTSRAPTAAELKDLAFAWKVVKHVKSNAIVLARNGQTVGIGPGQTNRVDSARIAIARAGDKARGSVMASDAFFPFPDSVEVARDAGVTAIIHPGGSIRDDEAIKVAEEAGMAMVLTGVRHFRH